MNRCPFKVVLMKSQLTIKLRRINENIQAKLRIIIQETDAQNLFNLLGARGIVLYISETNNYLSY